MVLSFISFILYTYGFAQPSFVAITEVNMIPMTSDRIFKNQTVLIRDNRIVEIGNPTEIIIPQGAVIVNGKDKFLLPGFINMYTHVNESNLLLYLANGQTTVRDIPSHINVLGLREQVAAGQLDGPNILAYGLRATGAPAPFHSQQPIFSAMQGREQVREAKRLGYDGMYIYATCDPRTYQAILDEAEILQFPVSGHFPILIDEDMVLASKQKEFNNLTGLTRRGELRMDRNKLITQLKRHEKAITPSLAVHYKWSMSHKNDSIFDSENMKYIPDKLKAFWKPNPKKIPQTSTYPYNQVAELIKELSDHGVQIFIGSDGGYPLVIPGFAFLDEIELFSKAGISPAKILKYATVEAANFLGLQDRGTIEVVKVADLVLLADNPLEAIQNVRKIDDVFVGGKWFSHQDLEERLNHLKSEIAGEAERFKDWKHYLTESAYSKTYRYSFYTGDYQVGAQILIVDSLGPKSMEVKSVMVADAPDYRQTYSFHRINNRRIDSLYILNKGSEGISEITITREMDSVFINGTAAFHGDFSYQKFAPPGLQLWTPFTSRYFELDNVTNYYLATRLSRPLNPDQSDIFNVIQIELNSEEFGEKYILDQTDVTVYKTIDDEFRIIYPGFSGFQCRTSLPFTIRVKIKHSGIPKVIAYENQIIMLNE